MKIYVASSWRNEFQQTAVGYLRANGFEVFDFKNPAPGNNGFHWSDIDPEWGEWTPEKFKEGLKNPLAINGFNKDFQGMLDSDACLLLLPCGRSAHLEAGFFIGARKPCVILINKGEPELMYKMAASIVTNLDQAIDFFKP